MKIAIDISQIVYETGVSNYTKELVRNLLLIDSKNEYILFGGSLRRKKDIQSFLESLEGKYSSKVFSYSPSISHLVWNKLHKVKVETLLGNVDVVHSSDWSQPPTNAKKVTTVHDLTPVLMPEYSHPKIVKVHTERLKWVKKEAHAIIVPSESAKKDLISLDFDSNKIHVIPEAPSEIYKPMTGSQVKQNNKKYNIKGKYLLVVGTAERKNVPRIIDAFNMVKEHIGVNNIVIIGSSSNRKAQVGVIYTGHVPNEDLPIFYTGAEALVYASLYEGFGLPILEAFACGCPVVTSDISSLPEVGGEAVVYVNPIEISSISKGIKEVCEHRENYIKKGKERVKLYTWKETAKKTLEVYQSLNK